MNRILLRYELLGLLRDTRTIMLSVVLPLILLPALLLTFTHLQRQVFHDSASDLTTYAISPKANALQPLAFAAFPQETFKEVSTESLTESLQADKIMLGLNLETSPQQHPLPASGLLDAYPTLSALLKASPTGQKTIEVLYRSDRDISTRSFLTAFDHLVAYRNHLVNAYFNSQPSYRSLSLESTDRSTKRERDARRYGPALAAFLALALLGGGSVAALDSLAGERERGTLVTLFLSPVSRRELLVTKFLAITVVSLAITLIQIANLSFYALVGWVDIPLADTLDAQALLVLSLIFVYLALFSSAMLLTVSAYCHTFKEAQLFFIPLFLIALGLSLSGLAPGLTSHSVVCLIPFAGPGVLIPEILAGSVSFLGLMGVTLSHVVGAAFLLTLAITHTSQENYLGDSTSSLESEPELFHLSRKILPCFAFLWAALMVVPSNIGFFSTLFGQTIFNQLILFVLTPLLLLAYFKVKPSQALPWRRVSPAIIFACLALIPLGQLAASGLSQLLAPLLPAPTEAQEQMLELLNISTTPGWKLFLLIAFIPGICEELAFRGVLLYALHRCFPPWLLAGVVAVIFGFFHMTFYKLIPTAYLGFFLGLLVLATGSLWPAVIVHIGNNSLAVGALLTNTDFESLSPWVYGLGFLGQIALTGFILRWGQGYPGTCWANIPKSES